MKNILLIILFVSLITSCEDLDQPMTREFTETSFWKTEEDALAALAACYDNMFKADYFFADNALSDDAYVRANDFAGVSQIAGGAYDARNGRITEQWGYYYTGIRKCNVFLENVDRVGLDEEKTNRLKGEARFIRAFAHFQLATWYGDVPLVKQVLTLSEAREISRTPRAEVINFVLTELEAIQPLLPPSYTKTEDNGRIMRGAAIALRARVNLYESNWEGVIADCEKLINTAEHGSFNLYDDYRQLFTVAAEYNEEVILDLQYAGSRQYATQRLFLPPTIGKLRANLVPTQSLVDNYTMVNGKPITDPASGYDPNNPYDNRDPRFTYTIVHHGMEMLNFDSVAQTILTQPGSDPGENSIENQGASATGYYFQKYYDPTAIDFSSGLNLIMIRYADVLLMYAEAKNELTQMTADIWNKTIRPIRERAGFTDASALDFDAALTEDQLREIIRRERRSELAFEGLHIFDLRRWRTAEVVLNGTVAGIKVPTGQFPQDEDGFIIVAERLFQPKHYLWPVPQFEIDQNPNLRPNNTGW